MFKPPLRILMGPGPSDVYPQVLTALGQPTIGHLDPSFIVLMEEVKDLLRYALQTKNPLTFPISGPGSAGMECCIVNLVEPGDKVVVMINGVFGARMAELVKRVGGKLIPIQETWGRPNDPQKLEKIFKKHSDIKLTCMVHAETSTGVLSDIRALAKISRAHDALVLVDAVTSLAGNELRVDEWGIDALYSGTQKCLSCVPGLSPVTFNEKAMQKIKKRKTPVPSWFFDLNLIMDYWQADEGARSYHHTAPVNSIYALHTALCLLKKEGLENSWRRHQENHDYLKTHLEKRGIAFLVAEKARLPQLNAVLIPAAYDDQRTRAILLEKYHLEIGAGLGELAGKIWRVGLMGHSCNKENIDILLYALAGIV